MALQMVWIRFGLKVALAAGALIVLGLPRFALLEPSGIFGLTRSALLEPSGIFGLTRSALFQPSGSGTATAATACRIAVLGDSLTAGFGLELQNAFPARLEAALGDAGYDCEVVDAGVSGDTSAGGLARLDWMLGDQPSHVILELGANDALRGLPPEQMEQNLDAILTRLDQADIPVLLTGMLAPPNLGRDYGLRFARVFARLAEKHDVPLYPFFLEGVAAVRELNQPDGIHPNGQGVAEIVERILPTVTDWLERTARHSAVTPTLAPPVIAGLDPDAPG